MSLLRRRSVVVALVAAAVFASGCGGKKKRRVEEGVAALSADATFRRAIDQLEKHEMRQSIATLKRIQFTPEVREEIEPLVRLALADATFYQGGALGWIDARNLYLDFVTLYGDHPLAPYAQTQAGFCSLKQVRHPSRDQSQTRQAIEDLRVVIDRFPETAWAGAAEKLLGEARSNLAESEYLVARFYLKRGARAAGIERLSLILERFPEYRELDKVVFYLGQAHVEGGSEIEGRIFLDKYIADYPEGRYAGQAKRIRDRVGGPLTPPSPEDPDGSGDG